jgi:putative NADPH-quinone reductase
MKKITIISGHPDIENSMANKSIVECMEEWYNANIVHLIEEYPDFQIDVEAEISRVKEADIIVLQFPFHWYGVPAILKMWIDSITSPLVYGKQKGALKGKLLIISTTTGGPAESYNSEGYNKYTMREFLLPLLKLGDSLGMNVLEPVVMHSAKSDSELVNFRAQKHALKIIEQIEMEHETVLE